MCHCATRAAEMEICDQLKEAAARREADVAYGESERARHDTTEARRTSSRDSRKTILQLASASTASGCSRCCLTSPHSSDQLPSAISLAAASVSSFGWSQIFFSTVRAASADPVCTRVGVAHIPHQILDGAKGRIPARRSRRRVALKGKNARTGGWLPKRTYDSLSGYISQTLLFLQLLGLRCRPYTAISLAMPTKPRASARPLRSAGQAWSLLRGEG